MRRPPRAAALVSAALAVLFLVAGCHSEKDVSAEPAPSDWRSGKVGQGFWDPKTPPKPEGTIAPSPGSWDDVGPKPSYQVTLLVDGVPAPSAPQTAVLAKAVEDWAASVQAKLTVITPTTADSYTKDIQQAIAGKPNVVISVGDGLVDPLAFLTATNLETEFLVIGAEIAEPTQNVTAADWVGASFRGEGLGLPETYNPKSFTPDRAARAVRAGVAAVLSNLTGIVVNVS
ncbi:hypothetical protein ACSMXN_00095 [Jatrophihabitans sp. DSM 45814]